MTARKSGQEQRKVGSTMKHATTGNLREVADLEVIPNVGPALAADLHSLGIGSPKKLPGVTRTR